MVASSGSCFPKCSKFWLKNGCWMTPINGDLGQKRHMSKMLKILAQKWVLDDANKMRFQPKNEFPKSSKLWLTFGSRMTPINDDFW